MLPLFLIEEEEEEIVWNDEDGTLVETPTRCNKTKNNLDDRVRISIAILTGGDAGGRVGLVIVTPLRRIARTRVAVGELIIVFFCSGWCCGKVGEEDGIIVIVKVIVVGGPGDQQGGVEDWESLPLSSSSVGVIIYI
jgi:hypothetical protein